MNAKGRSTYEVIIIAVIVVLTVSLAVGLYARRSRIAKGRMLIVELSSMRSGVTLYTMMNKTIPSSLEELVSATYDAGGGSQKSYVDNVHREEGGAIIDPFGNAYAYDPNRGWVNSTTDDYQTW